MSNLNERLAGLSPEKRALLMQQLARQGGNARQGIGRRPRPERIPLSSAQQRLWVLDQISPGSAVYNVPATHWLDGQLGRDALQRALDEIVRRHESLRTVIHGDENGPQQRVCDPSPVPVRYQDLRALPYNEREAAAFDAARVEAAAAFDIARGPLLRALLVQVDDERHLLVLNAHHIATDGWSLALLCNELRALYAAFSAGQPSPLPELPLQYIDYALWQREQLESEATGKQLDYWRERLSGRLPVLELPGDRPRPAVQSYRGAVWRGLLPLAGYEAVKQFSRHEGVTPFMTVLAAFNTLLMRYSGATDQIIGVGVANRGRQELESLIGFFVNTLALRVDLSGNPSFRELLGRVKEITLGAYSHQDLPIERLMEELDLDRALSHSPLFQAMLFFQNFPSEESWLPGLRMQGVDFDRINQGTARTDLALFASETPEGLGLFFEYATDLFDEATIATFCGHLQQLLRAAIAQPDGRIGELQILGEAERRQLLVEWNATGRELDVSQPVHAMIQAQARRTPDAIAVEFETTRLSYAELDAQAEAVADALVARGAGPGELVGLFVERSPQMLVAMLGVLKAGAAYVPLDPGFPAERLAFMLEDAAARLVVTQRSLLARVPASQAQSLLLEDLLATPPAQTQATRHAAGPDDLAYVIFTSGSTGRPKGVQIPHRAVANFLGAMAHEPGMTADDALCAVTTLSFDIAVLELLLPLTVGARVVLADRATASDGAALAALLQRTGCTMMQATPATWRMLLDAGWRGAPALRILCGGEALPRDLADRLLPCVAQLWNVYGPTETTVWSTVERVTAGSEAIRIGRPIANTEVYVVDAQMQPTPVGVPGELLIGGLGVARGYLARPELTAEKFIPDTLGTRPEGRLYRTGDQARWRRDGKLEVIGRIDHQVKLRGFRIELGEIECVLAEHESVDQAVVICREDRPGDKRLVAYVVASPCVQPGSGDLRAFVRERLPEYMVPSAFVVLLRLPTTPNGKVDRRALPAPEAADYDAGVRQPPRNAEEATLAALWAEVLGLESVGIHDNFFDLGGHSLLATQLIVRVQKAFGGDIALRLLFEAPTVAAFAERLAQQRVDSVDADELAQMLDQLEDLTDEQIQSLLADASA